MFYSGATDLDASETAQGPANVYLRNLADGRTELISTGDAGEACTPAAG
ncbi:hypothetical protein KIH74_06550 [Kineosporia sp. J2-2]|uniref:Uncharacterized protein n=1 Tax=Kineosporia corallincola TaxID=2835133 RepID=A0ABS5TCK5_9ACTN|nr:hypothetical protein [Kineosporia corallincola]MBT0768578.1 hypothetical protein [Kineosporia corallincola]